MPCLIFASPEVSAVSSAKRCFMRSIAQNRSTAVGRVLASVSQISSNSARSASTDFAGECKTPSAAPIAAATPIDRKSTRLNSSHGYISYAVFCLKKKKKKKKNILMQVIKEQTIMLTHQYN